MFNSEIQKIYLLRGILMKKLIVFLSALLLSTAVYAADPAVGLWKSIDDKTGKVTAIWKVYEEGGKLFGTIAATTDAPQDIIASACKESYKGFPVSGAVNKMKTVGTPWIFNMVKESEGNWKDGNIIDPSNGKMYGCVIKYLKAGEKNKKYTATGPTLAMAGTVGPIQVFQYWVPATEADIKAAQEKNPPKNK
jgi:uncharacterized protein (DUF2147 family)